MVGETYWAFDDLFIIFLIINITKHIIKYIASSNSQPMGATISQSLFQPGKVPKGNKNVINEKIIFMTEYKNIIVK